MNSQMHHDAQSSSSASTLWGVRTTVDLSEANLRAIEKLRAQSGKGLSAAVNELISRGVAATGRKRELFEQRSFPMGEMMDVSNIGALLEDLDGPSHR